jgi:hypothetical protein
VISKCTKLEVVDPLLLDDIEQSKRTDPSEKLAQALDLMATGIRLKRVALRAAHPGASDVDIEAQLERWLADG